MILIGIDENSIRNALKTRWLQYPQELETMFRQNVNLLTILNAFE